MAKPKNEVHKGEKAFELHKNIGKNEGLRRILLVKNIALLVDMYDEEYYKDILGDEEAEWVAYLAQLEIYYTRNQVYTYTKIYRHLTQHLKIEPERWLDLPITRLSECLLLLTKENVKEWFTKANVLTSKDWQIELKQAKGLISEEDEHEHDIVQYDICRICGSKTKHRHDSR